MTFEVPQSRICKSMAEFLYFNERMEFYRRDVIVER